MGNCKHGMPRDWCGLCNAPVLPTAQTRATSKQQPTSVVKPKPGSFGYLVVSPAGGRKNFSIQQLSIETTYVHINGNPMLWLIREILDRAPNLKTIRVIPTNLRKLKSRHRELLQQRGVEIVTGHHRPESAWEPDRGQISPTYASQRAFLLGLQGEQAELLRELCTFGFDAALMAARYFCLNGEEYVPQRFIVEEFGYRTGEDHYVSMKILAVLFYLGYPDPAFDPSSGSKRHANTLRQRVARLRPIAASATLRGELAQRYGFQELSPKLPLARLETYEAVLTAHREGRLDALKGKSRQAWQALTFRFGLDQPGTSIYRRLQEVADTMELTRQRVQQLETYALTCLNISEV